MGAPQAVRSLGGLGGGSVVQHAVLLGKLLFHGSIVLNGVGRQLGNVVTADGGDILAVDRTGAGGLQHGLDVGRGLAGGQLRNTGGGVVGVVLGQQIDACRDLDPADGADGWTGADMAQPASASTMETAIARLNSLVLMERMNWFSPL